MGPEDLNKALQALPPITHPNLIVGMEHGEDAGVYRLSDDLAIIQTVDFFTPIVDDPFTFGQIAAVNALSDVYAMGGRPLTAMNIICFPVRKMELSVLQQVLLGGLNKMQEAGVLLVGGHSVEDDELKYGLSVAGVIHPDRVLLNRGARAGDRLVLTKPLGTGIVSTAVKGGVADEDLQARSVACMTMLNREAAELIVQTPGIHACTDITGFELIVQTPGIHACTDITGFGLVGHAAEMIENSEVSIRIRTSDVPFFPGIRELVEGGIVPAGLYRNRNFRAGMVDVAAGCPPWLVDILFDPQTAGGLFVALAPERADELVRTMRSRGLGHAAVVGEVLAEPKGRILLV